MGYHWKKGRKEHHIITSIYLDTDTCEKHNHKLFKKYDEIEKNETEVELYLTDDAEIIIASYGTSARIVKNAINDLRKKV